MTDPLHDALSSIEGVLAAEVELSDDGPLSVRVRLAPGADEPVIAASVQRILEKYGLRSRVAPARRPARPASPPLPPGTPDERLITGPKPPEWPVSGDMTAAGGGPPAEAGVTEAAGIAIVAVEQSPQGATIRVTDHEGRTIVRRARPTFRAVDEAVVSAVGELVNSNAPAPGLISVEEGEEHVTVVLEAADASVRVGAALLGPGRSLAVGQAAWLALRRDL